MNGMDRNTGKPLDGLGHLRQSIGDILTTPIGSRVMRRDYGSLLPELIDQPQNAATTLRLYAATCSALMTWEPRLRLSRISLQRNANGSATMDLEGEHADTGNRVELRVPLQLGAVT
ncbi:MAG: GPW/gp25 family protein [Pseudomonadaceae bacterium]